MINYFEYTKWAPHSELLFENYAFQLDAAACVYFYSLNALVDEKCRNNVGHERP